MKRNKLVFGVLVVFLLGIGLAAADPDLAVAAIGKDLAVGTQSTLKTQAVGPSAPTTLSTMAKKPGKVEFTKLKKGNRSITAYWKEKKIATRYDIQVSPYKGFPSNATYNHVVGGYEGKATAQCTIENMPNKSRYYVRIRAWNSNAVGAWSKVRSVYLDGKSSSTSATYRLNHSSINLYKDQEAGRTKTYKLYLVNSKGKRVNTKKAAWSITKLDTTWSNYSFNYNGKRKVTHLSIDAGTWFSSKGSGPEYGSVYVKCKYKGFTDTCRIRVKNSYLAIAG